MDFQAVSRQHLNFEIQILLEEAKKECLEYLDQKKNSIKIEKK